MTKTYLTKQLRVKNVVFGDLDRGINLDNEQSNIEVRGNAKSVDFERWKMFVAFSRVVAG